MGFGHRKGVTKKHEGKKIFSKPQLVPEGWEAQGEKERD